MEYKRLTEKVNKGQVKFILKDGENPIEKFQNALNRLAELEDKIEQGTLIFAPKYKVKQFVYSVFYVYSKEPIKGQIECFDFYTQKYLVFFGDEIGSEWCLESELYKSKAEAKKRLKELQNG